MEPQNLDGHNEQVDKTDSVKEKKKTCFIIMPIADQEHYSPGHFNRVLDYIIKPACEKEGYEPIRADGVRSSNLIMFDILKRILDADMAICDLSARNPNVMYELAIRQCFDLPVILIKDNMTVEPFDSSGIRYVEYDKQLRIDLVDIAIQNIQMSIKATEESKNKDVFSLLQILGREKATVNKSKADPLLLNILEQVTRLTNQVNSSYSTANENDPWFQFIPFESVRNIVYPEIGTSLNSIADGLKIGDKVYHTTTRRIGTLVGLGSAQGTGAFLVKVDDGPLVAARPENYVKVKN